MNQTVRIIFCFLIGCVFTEGFCEELKQKDEYRPPSEEFRKYETTTPRVHSNRRRRSAKSNTHLDIGSEADLSVTIPSYGNDIVLDLKLHEDFARTDTVITYRENGHIATYRPTGEVVWTNVLSTLFVSCGSIEQAIGQAPIRAVIQKLGCEYEGTVRGARASWVSVTAACAGAGSGGGGGGAGIQGTIHNGRDSFYIEPALTVNGSMESTHYLYNENHRNDSMGICGNANNQLQGHVKRQRRNANGDSKFSDPYNVNINTLYNELLLVVDQRTYIELGGDLENVYTYCKRLTNHLNYLYLPLNIYIVLVEIIVWKNGDEIIIGHSKTTLQHFSKYRENELVNRIHHDNAHLITRHKFEDSVAGLGNVGGICKKNSGSVNSLTDDVVRSATILAHEMGHNFGMSHDNDVPSCSCSPVACVMNAITGYPAPDRWSGCSKSVLTENLAKYECLRNKPTKLFVSASCGNGFVESGEECDCGPLAGACANCCEVRTCRLRPNSTCASGACCNKQTCSIMEAGSECRRLKGECDLPEYCGGESEHCPQDLTKMDGEPCAGGRAFCYQGSCEFNTDVTLCQQLWGSSANSGQIYCQRYIMNGKQFVRDISKSAFRTSDDLRYCGSFMCHSMQNFESYNGWRWGDDVQGYCYQLNEEYVSMVPNGVTCGEDKMCVDQKCVAVRDFQEDFRLSSGSLCPSNCSGHGVCNSKGECHCDNGYAPPTCTEPGTGGSLSSGKSYRSENNESLQPIQIALYIVFLGIIPFVMLIIVLIRYNRFRKNNVLKMCDFCSRNPKSGTLLSSISQLRVYLSQRMASKASPRRSFKNNTPTFTANTISNMSSAETKIMNALSSNLAPNRSSNPERMLKETFNCDFKAALQPYKKNEQNSAPIGQASHGSTNIEVISVICHKPSINIGFNVVDAKQYTQLNNKSDGMAKISTTANVSKDISSKINVNTIKTNESLTAMKNQGKPNFTVPKRNVVPIVLKNQPKFMTERDPVALQNKSPSTSCSVKNSIEGSEIKNVLPPNKNNSQCLEYNSKTSDIIKYKINTNAIDKQKSTVVLHSNNSCNSEIAERKPTGLTSRYNIQIDQHKPTVFVSSNIKVMEKPTGLASRNDNTIVKQKPNGFSSNASEAEFITKLNSLKSVTLIRRQ